MVDAAIGAARRPGLFMRYGLWLAQAVVSGMFCYSGVLKLTVPAHELAKMGMAWPSEVSPAFLTFIGIVDLAGGIGVLLPALTRIQPRLTVLAALGCAALQIVAAAFHLGRGEVAVVPLNVVLLSLALFILWGRHKRVPIAPRSR